MNKTVKYIDLFAGLGGIRLGFSEGLNKLGISSECVFSSELKDYAIKAYKNYFGNEEVNGDITKIPSSEIPDFDFLLAGFPCQPFSSAGQRLGFADTRGNFSGLIDEAIRSFCREKGIDLSAIKVDAEILEMYKQKQQKKASKK